jgi:hypothetical protein
MRVYYLLVALDIPAECAIATAAAAISSVINIE